MGFILVLFITVILFVFLAIWGAHLENKIGGYGDHPMKIVGICGTIVAGFVFVCCFISMLMGPSQDRKFMRKLEAARQTVISQRIDPASTSGYERATLTQTILDLNTDLAERQYEARSWWWNWYSDKDILNVQPIK